MIVQFEGVLFYPRPATVMDDERFAVFCFNPQLDAGFVDVDLFRLADPK
jgi:hypothetical protein